MTPLLFAAVLTAAYPPAPPPEPKVITAPPSVAIATIEGEKLLITSTFTIMKSETRTVEVKEGDKTVQKTVTVLVPMYVPHITPYSLKDVKGFDTANKPIDAAKLAERLKTPTPVVISGDGQPIDEMYRKLLKDDVILLTMPQGPPIRPPMPPLPPDRVPPPPPPPDKVPPLPPRDKVPPPVALDKAPPAVAVADEPKKADEPKGKEVKFDLHDGHFESNKSGLKGDASFLVFTDKKAFSEIFGLGRTMGPKPNYVADNAFDSKMVFATIKRGNAPVTYKVEKVTADGDTLYVAYTTTMKEATNATFASPLIVSVDKGKYTSVVFIENGKKVGTADCPK